MTGIFQIFDRYKAKAYRKNDLRKAKNGEPESRAAPAYYLFQEDGVPRKVSHEDVEQRQAQSEASRDSRRSSSADTNEVVVKSLTSPKEILLDNVQKPHSTDSRKPSLALYAQDESWLPHEIQSESRGSIDLNRNSVEAETPKSAAPSRGPVERLKLPPRDTRGMLKAPAHKDRSRTENSKDAPASFDDARDISRAIMQLKEAAQSPLDMKEGQRRSSVVTRRDGQKYMSSGDEREGDKYRKEGRRYQSSGDEKVGHRYHSAGESRDVRKNSSATDNYRKQVYDDYKDEYRPHYPSEVKVFRHFSNRGEGPRIPAAGYVKDIHRYQSSGDEMDSQKYQSSGEEKGGHRFHPSSERREGHRHRTSVDREGHRNYVFVDRDGQRHQSSGVGKDETRYELSGDEKSPQRPYSSAERGEAQRHHHHSSRDGRGGHRYHSSKERDDGRGGHRYHSSKERDDGRRHHSYTAGRDGQRYQSSGDERAGHRYHTSTRDGHRKHSSVDYGGHRHQSSTDLYERHKYQSSGDERGGYRYHSSSGKGPRHQSSASAFEGRQYQSSGDERGGHRFSLSDREGGKRHDSSPGTKNRWRNESSDEDRGGFTHHSGAYGWEDGRRYSSATEAQRQHPVDMEEGFRYQASGDDKEGDRNQSSGRGGHRNELVRDARKDHRQYLNAEMNNGQRDGVSDDADEGFEIETSAPLREGHRRNFSVDSSGGHRRQSSALPKEVLRPHLSVDAHSSQIRDKESLAEPSKDLPPRSSGSRNTVSPRNLVDIRDLARLTVQVREGSQLSAPKDILCGEPPKSMSIQEPCQISVESNISSKLQHEFRETLRAIDFRDTQWSSEKGRDGSRNSSDGRDPPRTSSVSRISADSRQYQSSTPRLSVEGKEHLRASGLHSSRGSSVDAQSQLRTNSMDSNGSGDFKRRGPSVVARLMGLAELPTSDTTRPISDRSAVREGKSLQKLLNSTPPAESVSPPTDRAKLQLHLSEVALQMKQVAARLQQDSQLRQNSQLQLDVRPKQKSKGKSSSTSRSRSPPPAPAQQDGVTRDPKQHQGPANLGRQAENGNLHPLPKQPMSPKHHQMEGMPNAFKRRPQELPPGDVDQRLHQLRIKNSIQEHKTLKQILEAMHLKGLLHPPQEKQFKSLKPQSPELVSSREEAQRPLQDLEYKPSSSSRNVARSQHSDSQEILRLQDSLRKVTKVEQEPTPEINHTAEASIVVMKPVNHQSVSPPAATKEAENQPQRSPTRGSESSRIGKENPSEISNRGRSSERRAMTSGKSSRSHSLEPLEHTVEKSPSDELSFAKVMLSWRERIAADAARRAAVELAESKLQSRPKDPSVKPSGLEQRSRDSSPSRSGSTNQSATGQRNQEAASLKDTEEPEASPRTVQSEVLLGRAGNEEDTFNSAGRSKSDWHLVAPSAESMVVPGPSLSGAHSDKVLAQVAVFQSKRATVKANHSKNEFRTSSPGDSPKRVSTPMPKAFNVKGDPSTDQYSMNSSCDLDDIRKRNMVGESRPQVEIAASANTAPVDNSHSTPKKRKIEEPAAVNEEEHQLIISEVELQMLSEGEDDYGSADDSADAAATSVAGSLAGFSMDGQQDAQVDVAAKDVTQHYASLPKIRLVQEESGFRVQGADYPSPVSVLDSPIFQENFDVEELSSSLNSVKLSTTRHEGAEGLDDLDGAEYQAEPSTLSRLEATKEISDPLKDIYTKVARSLELSDRELYYGQSGAELQLPFLTGTQTTPEPAFKVSSEVQDQERAYVQDIMIASGLTDEASTLRDDVQEVMQFDVFTRMEEELQTEELNRIDRGELDKSEEKRYKESLDRRLIFDCMNEILGRKMSPFLNPQPWGTPVIRKKPSGQLLVDEVWDELQDMHWPVTDAYDALYALLQKDFMRKGFQWLDFSIELGEVGGQLEHMIFQDMVEEAVQDVLSIKPVRKSSPPPTSPAPPTPPLTPAITAPPSDDSETRRRELLEKTRRDLLAWHVQYQQL